jgi:hypothetical protein
MNITLLEALHLGTVLYIYEQKAAAGVMTKNNTNRKMTFRCKN